MTVGRGISMLLGVLALLSVSDVIGVGNPAVAADVRIKDIADFEGIRENQLVGYGLVVGLNGTGDTLNNSPFTERSLKGMLERFGVNVRDGTLRVDNVAAVIVTANLKPFARPGNRLDVDVAALGDSESLFGGQLLVTPLIGADGEVYAVAQGALTIGGFSAGGEGQAVTKNVPTVGRIANGGIIERETGFELASLTQLRLTLRNPDLTTAGRVAQVINRAFGLPMSHPLDPTTIQLQIPANMRPNVVAMLSKVEQLRVKTDQIARVVIDEKAGIIVMGQEVRIDPVAIAQGNLTVRVTETPQVSQPNAFASQGETQVVDRTDIDVDEGGDRKLAVLEPGINLKDLVDGLNALGIGPRDMISILQAIKAAGALQAEIVVM